MLEIELQGYYYEDVLSTTPQNKVIITLAVIPACFWPESRNASWITA
jgi:hypothetical protein